MQWLLLFVCFGAAAADVGFQVDSKTFADTEFQVVHVNPTLVDLALYWQDAEGKPFTHLADLRRALEGRNFLIATNSGIYTTDFKPLGLHVERGVTLRPLNRGSAGGGNFALLPNGVFAVTKAGAARVVETSEYDGPVKETAWYATQSGPLLLHRGRVHPQFKPGSENRKLRSGVGVDAKGQVVFAISRGVVNFYDFAMLFKDLGCANALYLDGTISQMLVRDEAPPELTLDFVGIWSVTGK